MPDPYSREERLKRTTSIYIYNVFRDSQGLRFGGGFLEDVEQYLEFPSIAWRQYIVGEIKRLAWQGEVFRWDSNPQLAIALKRYVDVQLARTFRARIKPRHNWMVEGF